MTRRTVSETVPSALLNCHRVWLWLWTLITNSEDVSFLYSALAWRKINASVSPFTECIIICPKLIDFCMCHFFHWKTGCWEADWKVHSSAEFQFEKTTLVNEASGAVLHLILSTKNVRVICRILVCVWDESHLSVKHIPWWSSDFSGSATTRLTFLLTTCYWMQFLEIEQMLACYHWTKMVNITEYLQIWSAC